jgi:hypothetical protein
MRYSEIINESQLYEGFVDSIKSKIDSIVNKPFQMVNNAVTSLVVIHNVISDANKSESICFLLRKQIVRKLKNIPLVSKKLWNVVPRGYGPADFLGMLILLPAIGYIESKTKNIKDGTLDSVLEALVEKLTDLKTIVTGVVNMGATGIFGAFNTLGIADEFLFQILNGIHQKMKAVS